MVKGNQKESGKKFYVGLELKIMTKVHTTVSIVQNPAKYTETVAKILVSECLCP